MASIHTLYGSGTDTVRPSAAHPLAAALREFAFSALEDLLRRMFGRADDALFELGERTQSETERRHYFDTVRVLRLEQARITQRFTEQLQAGYETRDSGASEAPTLDPEQLSIQPAEELEERIALTNLVSRAEGQHRQLVYEVERKLELAVRQLGLTIAPQALSPSRVCEAFAAGLRTLDVEFQIKLIVFKLFEREIVRELHSFYERVLALVEEHAPQLGAPARAASVPPGVGGAAGFAMPAEAPSAAAAQFAPPMGAVPPAVAMPGVDARTLQALQQQSAQFTAQFAPAAAVPGADGALAAELMRVLQSLSGLLTQQTAAASAPAPAPQAAASAQRLSLANQFFDRLLAEPLLPESARPTLERLRFPVIKTALSDPGFFAEREHPLRKLLGELVDQAVGTAIGEAVAPKAFGDSVARVAGHADIDAALVQEALGGLRPLDGDELDHFVELLREQEKARRELLLARVRRLVAQELEIRTLGREVPESAQPLLRSGMGPLLAFRLLKHGRSSAAYREAHALLERLLQRFERTPSQVEADALCDALNEALASIGMPAQRIERLLEPVRAPAPPPDMAPPVAAAPPSAETANEEPAAEALPLPLPPLHIVEQLERILQPGAWFRVYDSAQRTTRWLRLAQYYAHQDSIAFSGFDDGVKLSVRAQRFAIDLAEGRSEPINPDAAAQRAVETLRRARGRQAPGPA